MKLFDFLFPGQCPFCGKVISKNDVTFPKCEKCDSLLKKDEFEFTKEKYEFLPDNESIYCVYKYNGLLREAIIKYKFKDEIWLSKPFAQILIKFIEKYTDFNLFDIMVYVPVSNKTIKIRGYDQTLEIAKFISKEKNVPIVDCLAKDDNYGDNAANNKDRNQRLSENRYKFIGNESCVKNKKVLLLDDVVTTGSTLRECTSLLFEHGAENVAVAVLASGRRDI